MFHGMNFFMFLFRSKRIRYVTGAFPGGRDGIRLISPFDLRSILLTCKKTDFFAFFVELSLQCRLSLSQFREFLLIRPNHLPDRCIPRCLLMISSSQDINSYQLTQFTPHLFLHIKKHRIFYALKVFIRRTLI